MQVFLSYKTQKKSAFLSVKSNVSTLIWLIKTSIRFFFHPLPSRDFYLCYLGLTKSNRPLLDSVGFTLLYRLVVCPRVGAIYSAMFVMFTRFIEAETINPIHLPFGQSLSA